MEENQENQEIHEIPQSYQIQKISSLNFFNRLTNLDPLLTLDLRSEMEFQENHLTGSISLNNGVMVDGHNREEDNCEAGFIKIVETKQMYGKILLVLITNQSHNENTEQIQKFESIWQRNSAILHNLHSIFLLDCPYQEFYANYSLCISFFQLSPKSSSSTSELPNRPIKSNVHSYPNEILPNKLYLGHERHANDLSVLNHLNITHIIDATGINSSEDTAMSLGLSYLSLPLWDSPDQDITQYFPLSNQFIHTALTYSGDYRVLIHCRAGISRSTTLLIAYLLHLFSLSQRNSTLPLTTKEEQLIALFSSTLDPSLSFQTPFYHILTHLLRQRPVIFPNKGFCEQLLDYESLLFHSPERGEYLSYGSYQEIKRHIHSHLHWKNDYSTIGWNVTDERPLPAQQSQHSQTGKEGSVYENEEYLKSLGAYEKREGGGEEGEGKTQKKFLKRGEGKQKKQLKKREKNEKSDDCGCEVAREEKVVHEIIN